MIAKLGLADGNTFFHHKMRNKVTWVCLRSKQGRIIEFVLTRKADLQDLGRLRVL